MNSPAPFDLVITDHAWPDMTIETELFTPLGINVTAAHCKTREDVIGVVKGAHAVISIHAPITAEVVTQALTECKIIAMNAVGFNAVDIDAVTQAGILLVNCPDYCAEEVADHTLALLLSCARGIFLFGRSIKDQIWDYRSAGTLMRVSDTTLGLVGFGRIAQAVAARAKGFQMTVKAYDPHADDSYFNKTGTQRVSLEELLGSSDFISLHTPLTESTHNMISDPQLRMMKSSAFLINTSRGKLVDEQALVRALSNGTIRGAALDTLGVEPPDFNGDIMNLGNLIITPHAAFYSEEAVEEVRRRSAHAVIDVFQGKLPSNIINKEVLTNGKLRMKLRTIDEIN